jgi:exodeoxyribonuclease I
MQTYLFYDIETTGLSKSFDQVLQFAAIRTDLNLQELQRIEIKVKLNPDIIPAPRAIITHQIGIEESMQGSIEVDAMQQIHTWLNEPGTISIGYNTLGFDDEFLRFSFYRNLLPPYTHQYANQCKRMDLYPLTVMYFLYKNDILKWPVVNDKLSLKLEDINHANQLVQGQSHNAMVDVEVTLALAKRFFQAREIWDYVTAYFNKQTDQERFEKLPADFMHDNKKFQESLMVLGKFGAKDNYQAPVLYLGESTTYKNQSLWLRLDSETLPLTTENSISDNTWVIRKKMAEPPFILPPVERFQKHLSQKRQLLAESNKIWLQQNPALFQEIIDYHKAFVYANYANTDIDASLYLNDFWSNGEKDFCRRFHSVTPAEKAAMTEKCSNPKLKSLAIRVLGRHYPDSLTHELKIEFERYLQQISADGDQAIIDFKGNKRLTAKLALLEIEALRSSNSLNLAQQELINSLEKYLMAKWG